MTVGPTTRTAVLGLRIGDAWHGASIDGLSAWAWSTDARVQDRGATSPQIRPAVRGLGGVLAWPSLPGLGGWSAGPAPSATPAGSWDPMYQRSYTVLVVDRTRRYHPVRLALRAPCRDLVVMSWGDHDDRPFVRAYPTHLQRVPTGAMAVRARLWDPERATPAAWARLHVDVGGRRYTGLAGEDGEVVVFVATPPPRAGLTPAQQSWSIAVQVDYDALADLRVPVEQLGTLGPTELRDDLPTLAAIEQQTPGSVHATWGRVDDHTVVHTPFVPPPLTVRGDLYLASDPQPPAVPVGVREFRLFVTP